MSEKPAIQKNMMRPAAPVETELVTRCLAANEAGDGALYAALHRENYIYNKSADEWLAWTGEYWKLDEYNRALAAVEDVAAAYLAAAAEVHEEIRAAAGDLAETAAADDTGKAARAASSRTVDRLKNDRKKLIKRADKMRSEHGRQNCLKFAHTALEPLAVVGEELDQHPMLLATPSGVIDLETGLCRPGRHADFLTKASPTPWAGIEAPAPLWIQTLGEIFDHSAPLINYLQRLMGYGLTGLVGEHIFPVFQGRGRNGKTKLLDVICRVMGPLAAPIQPELLLAQSKNRSAAAPSPDIMALRGLRLAVAEETDEGAKFSASRVKLFSGGNELTGRNPHDKYNITFTPSHLLLLVTNNRPQAPAADYAFWWRMQLLEFKMSFVDNPKADHERPIDKTRFDRILATETSGVLAWLVEGCLRWQEEGLNPPDEVLSATHDYQRSEDMVGDFIDEVLYEESGESCSATEIYKLFVNWYQSTQGSKPPSQKWLGSQLGRRFDRRKSHGIYKYFGLSINNIAAAEYRYGGPRGDD